MAVYEGKMEDGEGVMVIGGVAGSFSDAPEQGLFYNCQILTCFEAVHFSNMKKIMFGFSLFIKNRNETLSTEFGEV